MKLYMKEETQSCSTSTKYLAQFAWLVGTEPYRRPYTIVSVCYLIPKFQMQFYIGGRAAIIHFVFYMRLLAVVSKTWNQRLRDGLTKSINQAYSFILGTVRTLT